MRALETILEHFLELLDWMTDKAVYPLAFALGIDLEFNLVLGGVTFLQFDMEVLLAFVKGGFAILGAFAMKKFIKWITPKLKKKEDKQDG